MCRTAARGAVERVIDLQSPVLARRSMKGRACPVVCSMFEYQAPSRSV